MAFSTGNSRPDDQNEQGCVRKKSGSFTSPLARCNHCIYHVLTHLDLWSDLLLVLDLFWIDDGSRLAAHRAAMD